MTAVKATSGNLILVGMMGAGKTTIGRLLAQRLSKTFVDADHEIEARAGVRIPVIFEFEGEEGFRKREAQVVEALTGQHNVVLATGGGAVTFAPTRALLKERGVTIYLSASQHDLWMRTRHDRNRPLLQVADPRARIGELLKARDPLYREVADLVVETGRPSAQKVVGEIINMLRSDPRWAEVLNPHRPVPGEISPQPVALVDRATTIGAMVPVAPAAPNLPSEPIQPVTDPAALSAKQA